MNSNYPDDIRNFDDDPRSPFYDDSFDSAMENIKETIADAVREDISESAGMNVEKILKDEINFEFDYFYFLVELVDTFEDTDKCIKDNILMRYYPDYALDIIVEHLLEYINGDIVNYIEELNDE